MATEYIFHQVNQPITYEGSIIYSVCSAEDNSLHDGDTTNPINIWYYAEEPSYHVEHTTYTANEFDIIECWNTTKRETEYYLYYDGKWNMISYFDTPFYNDDTARCEEGLKSFWISQWDDDIKNMEQYIYVPSYNPITINNQEVDIPINSWIVTSEYDSYNINYISPGFWFDNISELYRAYSAYYEEDEEYVYNSHIVLVNEICSHYLGVTTTDIQDGDTNPQVIISNITYTAKEYDKVRYSNNNHTFIYCDGVWYDATYRTNTSQIIADMAPPSYGPGDEIPEISEIIDRYPDEPGSQSAYDCVYPDRLKGHDVNVLTINGVTTEVKPFDTIRLDKRDGTYYRDVFDTYYTYIPIGVWVNRYDLLYDDNSFFIILSDVLEYEKCVELKWEDPNDITTYEPTPATWEGTIVIRKENSPPLNRWDGDEIVDSTTRDKYKTDPYRDENIQLGKTYYYGFFPYYTATTEDGHPIKFYRFTAVRRVDTGVDTNAPTILSAVADGTSVTVSYKIPAPIEGEYNSIKLYGKIGSNPKGDGNDDVSVDIDRSEDEVIVENLQPESTYYFAIITIQGEET